MRESRTYGSVRAKPNGGATRPCRSGPPRYVVQPGDRRIFFLTREGEALRSAADVMDYTIFVATGSHPDLKTSGKSFGDLLSEILLSPGKGYNSAALQHSLPNYCSIADYFGSREKNVSYLKQIMNSAGRELRTATCFYLAENYAGQYGCLVGLRNDAELSAEIRSEAEQRWVSCRHRGELLKPALRRFPLQAFSFLFSDSLYAVRRELQLLLDDPDPEVRALSCRAIRLNYPEPEPRCRAR